MKEITFKDIVGTQKDLEQLQSKKNNRKIEVQYSDNPYLYNKPMRYCGEKTIELQNGTFEKSIFYQFKGSLKGIEFVCTGDENEINLINPNDFHLLPNSQKNIEKINLIWYLDQRKELKLDTEWMNELNEKYNIDMGMLRNFGNIEPIYKKMYNGVNFSYTAELCANNRFDVDSVVNASFTEQEKEILKSAFITTDSEISSLLRAIKQYCKSQNIDKTNSNIWNINSERDLNKEIVTGGCLYIVKHEYDVDGGFGDSVPTEETLFVTLDKKLAEDFVEKYNRPTVYACPYSELWHGQLKIEEQSLIKSIDIEKITPELFGGVNTLNEESIELEEDYDYDQDDR
jgi:hypothetical protein